MLEKIFGVNWRTSFWGTISAIFATATFISVAPEYINFVPESIRGYVITTCAFIAGISRLIEAINSKDKQTKGTGANAVDTAKEDSLKERNQL